MAGLKAAGQRTRSLIILPAFNRMMDKLVGYQRIREITAQATIKEGYGA